MKRARLVDDPKLSHLATALDVNSMRGHFTHYLRNLGAEGASEVTHCVIENVYYRRAKQCTVLYRLRLRHPSGVEADEWFHGAMFPPGDGNREFEAEIKALRPSYLADHVSCGTQAVTLWREFDMILRRFPSDPGMPNLSYIVDLDLVRRLVGANLLASSRRVLRICLSDLLMRRGD
jgi:hypothetical protein